MDAYDFLFKFLIIGEPNTGKSCLLHYFLQRQFKPTSHTIGVEFSSKLISIGQTRIKLQIWDTAGQERFRAVTRSYYRGASGALLVYDTSNRTTFQKVIEWLTDVRQQSGNDLQIVLVGNKIDLPREVSTEEGRRLAQEHGIQFMETSALNGSGVEDVFMRCAQAILTKIETGLIDPEKLGSGVQYGTNRVNLNVTEDKAKCC